MASVFKRGQQLGRADGLNIFLKTKDGSPRNAADIYYNIYDFTTGVEVLLPPTDRRPLSPTMGEYFAGFTIPLDANIGAYRIRWFFREFVGSRQVQVVQEFAIVQDQVQVANLAGSTVIENDLIRSLRILLRDNDPARNYHFAPPAGEEAINEFTRVFGYLWESYELLEYLRVSNDLINMYPPMTFYQTLDQLITQHRQWRTLLLTGAMIYAIQAITLNWILDSVSYSIGGVSLDIDKASQYQSMLSDIQSRFDAQVEAAKETVKVILGLRQSRFGMGIRSSFGPSSGRGSLSPRRFLGV